MRKIKLNTGNFALVDNKNYKWLSRWKWVETSNGYTSYAHRNTYFEGKQIVVYMHREILGLKYGDKRQADHIDFNGLNNQEYNLRIVNCSQQQFNQRGVKGYYWFKRCKKWKAQICINGKQIHLGYFDREKDARNAYLKARIKYMPKQLLKEIKNV